VKLRRIVPKDVVPKLVWEVVAPTDDEGNSCELLNFLTGLPKKLHGTRDQLLARLAHVASDIDGPRNLPDKVSHRVDDNEQIWEFIKGDLRILWFYGDRKVVVCACGFVKKTQKTPKNLIESAIRVKEQYASADERRILDESKEDEE